MTAYVPIVYIIAVVVLFDERYFSFNCFNVLKVFLYILIIERKHSK